MDLFQKLSDVLGYAVLILVAAYWAIIIIRFFKNKYAPIKKVKAKVIDKYKKPSLRRYGVFSVDRYMVVFLVGDEKLAFSVSEFSFVHYKLHKKGTLKYKGNKIIEFS